MNWNDWGCQFWEHSQICLLGILFSFYFIFKKMLLSFQTQGLNQFILQNLCRRKFEPWFRIYDRKYEITNFCAFACKKCRTRSANLLESGLQIEILNKRDLIFCCHTEFLCAVRVLLLVPECSCLWFVVSCFIAQSLLKLWFFLCISAPEMSGFCREKLEISL